MMERGKRCYVDKDWEIGRASEGSFCTEGHSSLKPEAKGGGGGDLYRDTRDLLRPRCILSPFLLWGRSYLKNSCIMSEA